MMRGIGDGAPLFVLALGAIVWILATLIGGIR